MAEVEKKWKVLPGWKNKTSLVYPAWFLNIVANRGLVKEEQIKAFINSKYEDLSSPKEFLNVLEAAERIAQAKEGKEKVFVYGDYDVDGICSTAIMAEVLNKIGVQEVESYIPHREEEGYGLNKEAVEEIIKKGGTLLITVDCGITSRKIIDKYADKIEFIVCDHHEISEESLPQKAICIHPSLVKKGGPREFSAAGMVFVLARALADKFPQQYPPGQEKWLLDLVALSTICDVMPLVGENRLLAKFGLLVLSKTKRQGLLELMKMASIERAKVGAYEAGFILGPRLNAAGRLKHAKKALRLLTTESHIEAHEIAAELTNLNKERQEMCSRIFEEAKAEIELKKKAAKILVLSNSSWPRGVVGIIASKISDLYGRPAIVFENDGDSHHGSARSIEGFDITEALGACQVHLTKFGGHAKAAGLTVERDKLELFEKAIQEIAEKKLKKALVSTLEIDTEITPAEITSDAVTLIEQLEPFGYGNSTPIFKTRALIKNIKQVGKSGNHLKFSVDKPGGYISAIYFNAPTQLRDNTEYEIVFTLSFNEWNGRKTVDMRVIDAKETQLINVKG